MPIPPRPHDSYIIYNSRQLVKPRAQNYRAKLYGHRTRGLWKRADAVRRKGTIRGADAPRVPGLRKRAGTIQRKRKARRANASQTPGPAEASRHSPKEWEGSRSRCAAGPGPAEASRHSPKEGGRFAEQMRREPGGERSAVDVDRPAQSAGWPWLPQTSQHSSSARLDGFMPAQVMMRSLDQRRQVVGCLRVSSSAYIRICLQNRSLSVRRRRSACDYILQAPDSQTGCLLLSKPPE